LKDKIYIFTNAISRKNGGSSSIVDLANNLIKIGLKTIVYTPFGFLDKYIYKPTNVSKDLDINILDNNIYKMINKSTKKNILNKILNIIQLLKKDIKNSIVIDAVGLPDFFIKKLQNNGCKVIYNHAGSPSAVMKYFGMNGAKRENLAQAKVDYLSMINLYDHILFQSPTQAKELHNLSSWKTDKTIVLRPSASMEDIENVKKNKSILDNADFNIVIVGSVQERKGQHLLPIISNNINKEIKNIKFHIVGNIVDEEYKKNIEKSIKELNQEKKIILHGFRSDYLDFMNSSNVILQVSEEEGVSRILREAMTLKKVIISFKLDGTSDLLVDGEDSVLCNYGNTDEIVDAIEKVYNDRKLYKKLSLNALNNFEAKYSLKEYLKQLENLIKNMEI
jgi:glycosyltransferase involved in cell wall biosynthesis